jgi:hypothetical protein
MPATTRDNTAFPEIALPEIRVLSSAGRCKPSSVSWVWVRAARAPGMVWPMVTNPVSPWEWRRDYAAPQAAGVVGNQRSRVYHEATCQTAAEMTEKAAWCSPRKRMRRRPGIRRRETAVSSLTRTRHFQCRQIVTGHQPRLPLLSTHRYQRLRLPDRPRRAGPSTPRTPLAARKTAQN